MEPVRLIIPLVFLVCGLQILMNSPRFGAPPKNIRCDLSTLSNIFSNTYVSENTSCTDTTTTTNLAVYLGRNNTIDTRN